MNTHPSASADLSPKEYNKLQRDAIKLYTDAVWNLADVVHLGIDKFGRKNVIEMSPLPKSKIDWFDAIASLSYRLKALPELHYETAGLKQGKKWLKKAIKERLSPIELRKQIREERADYHRAPKVLDTAQWPKAIMQAENELKNFKGDKALAAALLKPLAELHAQFSQPNQG